MRWAEAGLVTQLGAVERNLAVESADETLARIEQGALSRCVLPWVSLMQRGAETGTIERWKKQGLAEPDNRARSDYGALALVFASAAKRKVEWHNALEGWNMTESPLVTEWIEQGVAKGRAQGLTQGLTQGRVQGEAAELVAVLEAKHGAVAADLDAAIRGCLDLATIKQWIKLAVHSESITAFRTAAGI